MGFIKANIEIANSFDMGMARRGRIEKSQIRKHEVDILVDTGAYNLSINENLAAQLGLEVIGAQSFELADGEIKKFPVAEPVEIRFKNRTTSCNPIILPGNTEMILGCIPLEDMDVVLDPRREVMELPPDRPYIAKKKLK
ncbi:MAG: retroviral-like aspartic protease family protein [Bacteroidetes bacterium]|nr:retroviral-like aspartic protease family protein [Bacteroidota bacterium]